MRHLIEAVRLFQAYSGVHFIGSPDGSPIDIDPDVGALFGTFDDAANDQGSVLECRIDLRNALFVRSDGEFKQAVAALAHERSYDGVVFTREKERKVIVYDPAAVTVLDTLDARCPEEPSLTEERVFEFAPQPGQHIALVTGNLAKRGLERVMQALGQVDFTYEIRALDVAVAAWLSTDRIANEIGALDGVDALVIPGKVSGDEEALSRTLGLPVLRGPGCYSEIPLFLEREGIEVEIEGNVRPKIVVLSKDPRHAAVLSETYEVPLIGPSTIEAEMRETGEAVSFSDARHNVVAEAVRSLLVSSKKGFVLDGYPRTERDARWLSEITSVDIVIGIGGEGAFYEGEPIFVTVREGEGIEERLVEVVEARMQACIVRTEAALQP